MKSNKTLPGLKDREFNGTYYPKIRRIREEPRQKVRQLLRSFILLEPFKKRTENQAVAKAFLQQLFNIHLSTNQSSAALPEVSFGPCGCAARCIFVHKNILPSLRPENHSELVILGTF